MRKAILILMAAGAACLMACTRYTYVTIPEMTEPAEIVIEPEGKTIVSLNITRMMVFIAGISTGFPTMAVKGRLQYGIVLSSIVPPAIMPPLLIGILMFMKIPGGIILPGERRQTLPGRRMLHSGKTDKTAKISRYYTYGGLTMKKYIICLCLFLVVSGVCLSIGVLARERYQVAQLESASETEIQTETVVENQMVANQQKVDHETESDQEAYYLVVEDGFLLVFLKDKKTICLYTHVPIMDFPEKEQERLREGIWFPSMMEVFNYLESYTS